MMIQIIFTVLSILGHQPALAEANHCPYQLVQFKNETGVARVGFSASPDGEIVTRVVEITDLIPANQTNFISEEAVRSLSEIQCRLSADASMKAARVRTINPSQVLAAIPQPKNIVAMGLNERGHAAEVGQGEGDGFLFSKRMPISGPYDDIVRPAFSILDYEVELGVVIRKEINPGTRITAENLREYIAGFVLTNDVSNRAPILLTMGDSYFTQAKTYPSFLPVGPVFAPIENFAPPSVGILPHLRMETLVLRARDAAAGNISRAERRQFSTTDEREFYVGLAGAIQLALENRNLTEFDAQLVPQKLLLDGKFEAGDLLLMGTIAGVALQLKKSDGLRIAGEGVTRSRGDSFSVFWPHYEQFFRDPNPCADHNYGGPYPLRCMENWMRMKSWLVGHEYCTNDRYMTPGEAVVVRIEGLGMQMNAIVSNRNNPATQQESALRADQGAMRALCGQFGRNWQNWAVSGGVVAGGIAGGFLATRYLPCRSLFCRISALTIAYPAFTAATLYGVGHTLLSSRSPTIAEIRATPRYRILVSEVGQDIADEIEFAVLSGMSVRDAVMANVRSATMIQRLYDQLRF